MKHCKEIKKTNDQLPGDGVFDGFWTAYEMSVCVDNKTYIIDTAWGCRGIKCPVKLTVEKGYIIDFELK